MQIQHSFYKASNQISLHPDPSIYLYHGPGPVGTHTVGSVLDRSQVDRNVTKLASVSVTPAIISHGYAHNFTRQKKVGQSVLWLQMEPHEV